MRRDATGFWSIDSSKLLRASKEPYLLPMHAQQAFFYKNLDNNQWWQIVHVNLGSRRIFDTVSSIVFEDVDTPSVSTIREVEDPVSMENMVVRTSSSSDEEEDQEDLLDNDEDLPEFDIEQNLGIESSNIVQLPSRVDLDPTQLKLIEAQADNEEVALIVDIFCRALVTFGLHLFATFTNARTKEVIIAF